MKLSVIIPTLNEANNLRILLPLLLENLQPNDEIIIADAKSCDNSEAIAKEYGVEFLVIGRGRAKQMNAGAKRATGDVLYFVHADTRPPQCFRNDIEKSISSNYNLGCYRFQFDSKSSLLKINSYFTRFDKMMCRGGDQTLFVVKDTFNKLQGFDEQHIIMEDYDFLKRARKQFAFCIMDGDVVVSARKYQENSYLRVNLSNFVVFKLYQMGMPPQKLDGLYKKLIKHPKA